MRKNRGPHVDKLMGGHHHKNSRSPAEILMHGGSHRAEGGGFPMGEVPMSTMGANIPRYKEGGEAEAHRRGGRARRRHAEGDSVNPVTGERSPGVTRPYRKGGRACHAAGDSVKAEEHRRGGRAHRRGRQHHFLGDLVNMIPGIGPMISGPMKAMGLKEGGQPEVPYRKGGRAHRREHHDFGETVGKALEFAGPLLMHALPLMLNKGGRARHAEGDEVAYRRGGRAHSRRHHSEGGEAEEHRRGGRARRRHAEGDEVEMKPLKRAMGGAGKVRKGMMDY